MSELLYIERFFERKRTLTAAGSICSKPVPDENAVIGWIGRIDYFFQKHNKAKFAYYVNARLLKKRCSLIGIM